MHIKFKNGMSIMLVMLMVMGGMLGLLVPGGGKAYAVSSNWTSVGPSLPSNVSSFLNVNGTLYAGSGTGGSNGVWSYDGTSWTEMIGSPGNMRSLLNVNGLLYAGALSGVSKLLLSPDAPANLQASNTTSTSTKLTWDAVFGATSYNIYENGGNTAIATATSANYMVSGLTPDTSYTFTAIALNAGGVGAEQCNQCYDCADSHRRSASTNASSDTNTCSDSDA
jgi:hypothetical protein